MDNELNRDWYDEQLRIINIDKQDGLTNSKKDKDVIDEPMNEERWILEDIIDYRR